MTSTERVHFSPAPAGALDDARHQSEPRREPRGRRPGDPAARRAAGRRRGPGQDLLRAAAGAGKSYALRRMVKEALEHPSCSRVAVPRSPTSRPSRSRVTWARTSAPSRCACSSPTSAAPTSRRKCWTTSRWRARAQGSRRARRSSWASRTSSAYGASAPGCSSTSGRRRTGSGRSTCCWWTRHGSSRCIGSSPSRAWRRSWSASATWASSRRSIRARPWRGDPGYNPYRAWPTEYERSADTCSIDLPAVWRPTAEQLPLWPRSTATGTGWTASRPRRPFAAPARAAAPSPRRVDRGGHRTAGAAGGRRARRPRAGRHRPAAPRVVERLLEPLLAGGFEITERRYDGIGNRRRAGRRLRGPVGRPADRRPGHPQPGRRRRHRDGGAPDRALRPPRGRHPRVDRRLLAGPDEPDHDRRPPALRRGAARQFQLRIRPSWPSPAPARRTVC